MANIKENGQIIYGPDEKAVPSEVLLAQALPINGGGGRRESGKIPVRVIPKPGIVSFSPEAKQRIQLEAIRNKC